MIEPYVSEKQCKTCRECKPVTAFCVQTATLDGYQNVCKVCKYARERAQYAARKPAGLVRRRNVKRPPQPLWPLPTHTLSEGLDCVRLRKWRYPVEAGQLRCSL